MERDYRDVTIDIQTRKLPSDYLWKVSYSLFAWKGDQKTLVSHQLVEETFDEESEALADALMTAEKEVDEYLSGEADPSLA